MNKTYIKNIIVILIALVFAVPASIDFLSMHAQEQIADNPHVSDVRMLSYYSPGLKGTASDTELFILDSGKPGGTLLVLGGTHPNESAGMISAISLMENLKVNQGRVIVIPWTNKSGFTHTSPLDGMLDKFDITLADGCTRTFRIGNRLTNPVDQWPDRSFYKGTSGRKLVGTENAEIRNVNRMYYGKADGVLTEKVCYGIFDLIQSEDVNLVMDMHEGSPEFLYLDCTMVNWKQDNSTAMSIASSMALSMQLDGLDMRAEYSGKSSYGLSHRSLGDNTSAMMTLMETYNPSMGPLHGKMDEDLIVNGNEPNYLQAHRDGYVYFDVPENGYPLIQRVARHVTCISYLCQAFSEENPDKAIVLEGIGTYDEIVVKGLEGLLKPVK